MNKAIQNKPIYAGLWVRLGSILVDFTLIALFLSITRYLLSVIMHPILSTNTYLQIYLYGGLLIWLLVFISYYSVFNANGKQSLGKKIFGLQIVNEDNDPLKVSRSFWRSVVFLFDTIIFFLGHLVMVFSKNKQTLHDMAAKSYVIRIRPKRKLESFLIILFIFVYIYHDIPLNYFKNVRTFNIPNRGMNPTLLVGDHVLVDTYWTKHNQPVQGDLIVFKYPRNEELVYIKRCIALPGHKFEIKKGIIYIDDEPEGDTLTSSRYYDSFYGKYLISSELKTPSGRNYKIEQFADQDREQENFGPITIPQDRYFVLGDCRDNSADSRVWGYVRKENIIGKAGLIYYSWNKSIPLYRLLHKIRLDRLGMVLK